MADTYTTGTITVGAGGSPIVGSGTAWASIIYRGDMLVHNASGVACLVDTITDDTHIVPFGSHWPGGAVSGAAYTIYKNSPLRFNGASAMQVVIDAWEMLQETGVIYAVVGVGVLPDVGIGSNGQYAINLDDSPWSFWKKVAGVWVAQASLVGTSAIREKLTANRTYYVRADGSNSNTGLVDSAGGAFLTIQKAVDVAIALDLSIYSVTIQVRAGTFTTPVSFKSYIGVGPINLFGDTTTPSNVVISTTSAGCILADDVLGGYSIGGFKLQSTTSGHLLTVMNGSKVNITGKMEYGSTPSGHVQIYCPIQGTVRITANYTISAGAAFHFLADGNSFISNTAITVTVSGTPAFSTAFAYAQFLSVLSNGGITFSGSATGKRYDVSTNAVIYTGGGGANYFPGNTAGASATGGIYI